MNEEKDFFKKVNLVADNLKQINEVNNLFDVKTINELLTCKEKIYKINQIADELSAINPKVVMIASEEEASLAYNKKSGEYTLYMPQGLKGDKGESFKIDVVADNKTLYDEEKKGFTFLSLSEGKIYFKLSDKKAHWSEGLSFGGGELIEDLILNLLDTSTSLGLQIIENSEKIGFLKSNFSNEILKNKLGEKK